MTDTDNRHIADGSCALSVIIPVFNMEESLNRCIQSVVEQDCSGLEIIVIDDGSTDNSPALCDQWAERDSRVRVIHKPNGGLSRARNTGIAASRGRLITFVDADDFIAPHTYSSVMACMDDECDLIEYSTIRFYGSKRESLLSFDDETFTDMVDYWLRGKAYAHSYACNKIFRRQLFSQELFPDGLLFEDVHILPRLLSHCHRVRTTVKGLYYYCDNPRGITATARGKALRTLLDAHLTTHLVTSDRDYYLHVLNIQLSVCGMTGQKPVLPPMRIGRFKGLNLTMRLKILALNILGLNNLCKLYRTICRTTRRW